METNGRGRKNRRRKRKDEVDNLQYSVREDDPEALDLDVRRTRRGAYVALPARGGKPWSEVAGRHRQSARDVSSTEGMDSEEGYEVVHTALAQAGLMSYPKRRARSVERVDNIRLARMRGQGTQEEEKQTSSDKENNRNLTNPIPYYEELGEGDPRLQQSGRGKDETEPIGDPESGDDNGSDHSSPMRPQFQDHHTTIAEPLVEQTKAQSKEKAKSEASGTKTVGFKTNVEETESKQPVEPQGLGSTTPVAGVTTPREMSTTTPTNAPEPTAHSTFKANEPRYVIDTIQPDGGGGCSQGTSPVCCRSFRLRERR